MRTRISVTLIFIFFCSVFGFSEQAVVLSSADSSEPLDMSGPRLEYYLDTTGGYDILRLAGSDIEFSPLDNNRLGLLDQDYDIWLRFTVAAGENADQNDWIIGGWPESFQVTLYEPFDGDGGSGTLRWNIRGDVPGLSEDSTIGRARSFVITPSATGTKRYYLRIGGRPGWFTGITLSSIDTYIDKSKPQSIFYGVFYGILLALFVYNLMLYFFIHDVTFLWYLAFLAGMAVYFLKQNGYLFLLFPGLPAPVLYSVGSVSMALGMIFAVIFSIYYLRINSTKGVMFHLSVGLIVIWLLIVALSFFLPKTLVSRTNSIGGLVSVAILSVLVIIRIRQKFKYASYYLVAWGVMWVSEILYALVPFRVLPITKFTTSILQIGTGIALLLFSLALGYRIKMLQDSMDTFRKGAEHLERINSLDPLSGLLNRSTFNQVLDAVFHNYSTSRKTFSVLFIDIDNFKSVNDNYGHQCGDRVISGVAAVIKSALRESDQPFRYGGEEFVVILPGSNKETAHRIGERIRVTVEQTEFKEDSGNLIRITISTGISEIMPHEKAADMIRRADEALYAAKRTGKNRIELSS